MPTFESFLFPERKPPLKFRLQGFAEEFELRVISREEERLIAEQYENVSVADRMDLTVAFGLVNPPLRNKEYLDALSKREGRPVLDPLDALHATFTANECNALFSKYSTLADLTVDAQKKVDEIKNG